MRNELPERFKDILASDCWPEDWSYDAVILIEYFQDCAKKAEAEIVRLRSICPNCYQPSLQPCDCPLDGPGEGVYCPKCRWTHMDPPPNYLIGRLEKQLADLRVELANLKATRAEARAAAARAATARATEKAAEKAAEAEMAAEMAVEVAARAAAEVAAEKAEVVADAARAWLKEAKVGTSKPKGVNHEGHKGREERIDNGRRQTV